MKTLYCDASFDWTKTEKSAGNVVVGKIAIADGKGFERIENVAVGKVEGLQQYINVFELTAIARAVELASEEKLKADSLTVITDSKTAMFWARAGRIKKKGIETLAHSGALSYLSHARTQFKGEVIFDYVPREQNWAGKLLEIELEKQKAA